MKFTKFLGDRKFSIISYILFMIFISTIVYVDETVKIDIGNLFYINVVSGCFFVIYLIAKYFYHIDYYKKMINIVENGEIINQLPYPKTYEQELLNNIIMNLSKEQSEKIENLHEQKKEYDEFINSWVHQIKTPISVSKLVIESNLNSYDLDTLISVEEEIDKIDNYIEQFLYFYKIDNFSKDYLINDVDLELLVKEAVKKQAKQFISKRISIEIDDINVQVMTDKKWITFIIDQVISNSLKYTHYEGNIKIYGLREEKRKSLIIEDNGKGIKLEDIERVFDKGFTGNNGREGYNATGLGLYLSKKLANKLGHDIKIESKYGEYTRVMIIFPKIVDYLDL